ncbi:ParB N-terminal domain-containing protein [Actinacidiphila sp. bgisy160]|uniref:ParB N-terminal domain-containing protein n=1 Tax=Actinacidiphila sp. bgisy160 TaxID=3413796 RepID=UPI003D73FE4B
MTTTPSVVAPRWTAYMPLEALTPAARNPKRHELARIKASIRDHGFVDMPIADERTGRIIGGHGRREALIDMYAEGESMPGGLILDEDGGWLVPIARGWASRNDREAEALIIQLNRLTAAGGWDERVLAAMLEDLVTEEPDLFDSLAMSDEEMDELLRAAPAASLGEEDQAVPLLHLGDDEDDADTPPGQGELGVPAGNSSDGTCHACGRPIDG